MLYVNRSTIIAIILLILRSFQRKGLCNSGLKAKSTTFVRNITTIRLRSQFVILKMNINMTDKIEKRRQPLQYRTMAMTTTIMSMVRASAAMTAAWKLRRHELCRELQRITSKKAIHTRRCSSTTIPTIWEAQATSPTWTVRWCSILSMCRSAKYS